MRQLSGLACAAGVAALLVLPSSSSARWEQQCATITKSSGSPVFNPPVTITTCRDVWIPDDRRQNVASRIGLLTAVVELCQELDMKLEPCVEYLTQLSAGASR